MADVYQNLELAGTVAALERLMSSDAMEWLCCGDSAAAVKARSGDAEAWETYERFTMRPGMSALERYALCVNLGHYSFAYTALAARSLIISLWDDAEFQHCVEYQREQAGDTIYCELEDLVNRLRTVSDSDCDSFRKTLSGGS